MANNRSIDALPPPPPPRCRNEDVRYRGHVPRQLPLLIHACIVTCRGIGIVGICRHDRRDEIEPAKKPAGRTRDVLASRQQEVPERLSVSATRIEDPATKTKVEARFILVPYAGFAREVTFPDAIFRFVGGTAISRGVWPLWNEEGAERFRVIPRD